MKLPDRENPLNNFVGGKNIEETIPTRPMTRREFLKYNKFNGKTHKVLGGDGIEHQVTEEEFQNSIIDARGSQQ